MYGITGSPSPLEKPSRLYFILFECISDEMMSAASSGSERSIVARARPTYHFAFSNWIKPISVVFVGPLPPSSGSYSVSVTDSSRTTYTHSYPMTKRCDGRPRQPINRLWRLLAGRLCF